jgi:hypothetical protein
MHMYYALIGYLINTLGSITYLLKLEEVVHSHTKIYKEINIVIKVINN